MDPMDIELVNAVLATKSTQSRGGVVRQAIAAIENALLDVKGKALAFPSISCSAASCATAFRSTGRIAAPPHAHRHRQTPPVRSYDDMTKVGAEVKRGLIACKTKSPSRSTAS